MKKNYLWIQIIAVIIIQAMFLTQADFSLAASYHSQETYQQAALKFQKIADKKTSLIIGAACVQATLNSLCLPKLTFSRIFSILSNTSLSFSEFISKKEVRLVSNNIYKDFIHHAENIFEIKFNYKLNEINQDLRAELKTKTDKESTAPPVLVKNTFDCFKQPNC
ncbi:MAG: hypothetical protein ABIG64_04090 [Candidatus Omnitrophota bacterium]